MGLFGAGSRGGCSRGRWRLARSVFGDGAAGGFFCGVFGFVVEHPGFLAAGAAAFLSADLFAFLLAGGAFAVAEFEEAFSEGAAGEPAVVFAGAGGLEFDPVAGGEVGEADGGGGFVDFLPAGAGAEDELFAEVVFVNPRAGHEGLDGLDGGGVEGHMAGWGIGWG